MDRQVFQTDSRSRWTRFKWSIGIILTIVVLLVVVFVVMFFVDRNPNMPFKEEFRSALTAEKPFMRKNKIAREYNSFRSFFRKESPFNYDKWSQLRESKSPASEATPTNYIASWNDHKAVSGPPSM